MNAEAPSFDPVRILEALHRHGVEYLVVGGVAGQAHGATRATNDLDCVPRSTKENLQRLAVAMRELGARLRVEGMSDDEARQLPVQLDSEMLDRLRVSTWITDAGLFDVLMDIPDRQGGRATTRTWLHEARSAKPGASWCESPASRTSSSPRSSQIVRRTVTRSPSSVH